MSIKWGEVEFEGPYPVTDWEQLTSANVSILAGRA